MTLALPPGARARPQRLAVSHLERALAGTLRSWALRAVRTARTPPQSFAPDVYLYGPKRHD